MNELKNPFSTYSLTTGLFTGGRHYGDPLLLILQSEMEPDVGFVMGLYDQYSQRVDLKTGLVVDYVPPQEDVPPPPSKLEQARACALEQINNFCASQLALIRKTYPLDEVTSWGKQENEARALTADSAAPAPLLSAIAAARGVPLLLLAQKVIEKADAFALASGAEIGRRQMREQAIEAASTVDELIALLQGVTEDDDDAEISYLLSRFM